MLIHNVYFWLKNPNDPAEHSSLAAGLEGLMRDENMVQGYWGKPGATPKRDVIDDSYDYALVLIFDDAAAHDRYQVSDIHQEFVANNEQYFGKVTVYDIGT